MFKRLLLIVSLALAVPFVLAACTSSGTPSPTGTSGPTPFPSGGGTTSPGIGTSTPSPLTGTPSVTPSGSPSPGGTTTSPFSTLTPTSTPSSLGTATPFGQTATPVSPTGGPATAVPASEIYTLLLQAQGSSGQSGMAVLQAQGSKTEVGIGLLSALGGGTQATNLDVTVFNGTCQSLGTAAYPGGSLKNGIGTISVNVPLTTFLTQKLAIAVHPTGSTSSVVSCGDVSSAVRLGGTGGPPTPTSTP